MNHRAVALLLALVLPCLALSAQEKPAEHPVLLDREAVLAEAAKVTTKAYPNASEVLVDDHIKIVYQADGTAIQYDETYSKILTEKGKNDSKTLSMHFTIPYGRAEVAKIELIKPDGTVVPVDVKAQSRVMVDRSQMGSNIYNPNSKVLTVGIPGLEVGDVIHYLAIRHTLKTRMPDTFSDFAIFEWDNPIRRLTYEIVGPKDLPLKSILLKDPVKDTVKYTKTERDDTIRHLWTVTDVPRMYREPAMPPLYNVAQRLLVSTIPDWKTISRWYWTLSKPHIDATTDEMKAKVKQLTADKKTDREKIEAVFFFVAQKVRYMGITTEKDAPGYEPHPASMTFNNMHGVCRDKAALLVTMLRLAGFDAYPVLIHQGPKKDDEVPQPYFNHAIVAVQQKDGPYQLMDCTSESATELFPAALSNKSYLVARPEGETLLTSPIVPADDNMMTVATTGRMDKTGSIRAETRLAFGGVNGNVYRYYFARWKPEQLREFFEGVVKSASAGAVLDKLTVTPTNLADMSTPLAVTLQWHGPSTMVSSGRLAMMQLPRLGQRVGMVNFILGKTGLPRRTYPFVNNLACGVEETLSLEVDPAVEDIVSMPRYRTIDTDTVLWDQSVSKADNRVVYRGTFKIRVVEFSPKEYLQLKDMLGDIEFDKRKQLIVKPSATVESVLAVDARPDDDPVRADVTVLENHVTYRLDDAGTWTSTRRVKKRVLTQAGKQSSAELKLNYNPAWETAEVTEAKVTTGGTTQSISEKELNVMDADWVSKAPRYPEARTLVASLPRVDIGSVIEYTVVRTSKDKPMFAAQHAFAYFDPIERMTLTIDYPADVPMHILEKQVNVKPVRTEADGRVRLTWTVSDVKGTKREPNLPPWWSMAPTVFASTGSWTDYARTVNAALVKAATDQTRAAELGHELAEGAGNDTPKKLVAIRDWVARNIREAGPDLDQLPLASITPADKTLADGYGNSADRAVVLYALLQAAGFEPEYVLASYQSPLESLQDPLVKVPDPENLGDTLVRVKTPRGWVYLNDTGQYATLGATPHDGYPALVPGTGRFEPVRALPGRSDRSVIRYDVKVDENGTARITRIREFHGDRYEGQNHRFSEMPPEERSRYHQELVGSLSRAARPVGELETDFSSYPGTETFTVQVDRWAVRDGSFLYMTLPDALGNVLGLRGNTRRHPLYRSYPRRATIHTTIHLPGNFHTVVMAPARDEAIDWQGPGGGSVGVSTEVHKRPAEPGAPQVLGITQSIDLPPAVIPADDYDQLVELTRRLMHPAARTIMARLGEE